MFQIGLMGFKHKQKIKPSQKNVPNGRCHFLSTNSQFSNFLCSKGQKEVHYPKSNQGISLFNVSISFNT